MPVTSVEKPTQFRPRLLRAKRKDKPNSGSSNNNNNNNVNNNNNSVQIEDDWVKHRREMEEENKR